MSRVECFHPSCHCSFACQASMRQHYRDRHDSQDQQLNIACNDCSKVCGSTPSLHQHQWGSPDHTHVLKIRHSKDDPLVYACSQCGHEFGSGDDLEEHFVDEHRLIEVAESSEERCTWQLVAERFISSCKQYKVRRILKVYNTKRRRDDFVEYRKNLKKEMSNMQEDNLELHNRVLRDGNEMLRYHETTAKCRLGKAGSASLCASEECNLCFILRKGFKKSKCKEDSKQGIDKGIYSSSMASKASEYVKRSSRDTGGYKVMMVWKVLAGRPHRHSATSKNQFSLLRWFSTSKNIERILEGPPRGCHSVYDDADDDQLFVYDDRAILPAFIILYSIRPSACQRFLRFLFYFILFLFSFGVLAELFAPGGLEGQKVLLASQHSPTTKGFTWLNFASVAGVLVPLILALQ